MRAQKLLSIFTILVLLLLSNVWFVQAVDTSPTPTPDSSSSSSAQSSRSTVSDCADNHISVADCPNYLQNKLSGLQGQEKTLSSQIAVANGQINLTQARIYATQQQIVTLTIDIDTAAQKITQLQSSVENITHVLYNRIVATYKVGSIQPLAILLTSNNIGNFLKRADYLRIAQAHDKQLVYQTLQAKNDYANQKSILEDERKKVEALKSQLQAYTQELDQEKTRKENLLTQTQGNEANYERLLAAARAQLSGFQHFVSSQGGASLLSGQTVCDDWGCYYNQRDSQWGGMSLNNTSYSIAEAGCLMTSMAMVYTHYGHRSVTPVSIDSNSGNFASYEPAYLLRTIVADGASSTRVASSIDGVLSAGNPVIVGISYDGGPVADHFVVLISGSSGNYQMNDPFTPNGHNISFTSHYSLGSIVEIDKVSF
jgi:peptidoglycan hydrolase CwlO-like protein